MNNIKRTNQISEDMPLASISYDGEPFYDKLHSHKQAQLMYCSKGIVEIQLNDKILLVPPSNAIWITSNTPHAALSKKKINFRSLYFDTFVFKNLPVENSIISVSPLLRELIFEICGSQNNYNTRLSSQQTNLANVLIDQINNAKQQPFAISVPNIKVINSIYDFTKKNLSEAISVDDIAKQFAMSSKTLTRLFQKHTGMTFEQWRQQIKILEAISLITYGARTTEVSQQLGYSSDSAFIYMFKKSTGKTPKEFFKP